MVVIQFTPVLAVQVILTVIQMLLVTDGLIGKPSRKLQLLQRVGNSVLAVLVVRQNLRLLQKSKVRLLQVVTG